MKIYKLNKKKIIENFIKNTVIKIKFNFLNNYNHINKI